MIWQTKLTAYVKTGCVVVKYFNVPTTFGYEEAIGKTESVVLCRLWSSFKGVEMDLQSFVRSWTSKSIAYLVWFKNNPLSLEMTSVPKR